MSVRGTYWSITIFYDVNDNPVDETYTLPLLEPGWKCEGQIERCPETQRLHFQGKLKTPQVRLSKLSSIFGKKNHFEIAKNIVALSNYVHKQDTRVCEVATQQTMNMYEFSDYIVGLWKQEDFEERIDRWQQDAFDKEGSKLTRGDIVLEYVDSLVRLCIREGVRGAEWHATNPAFRAMWKKFGEEVALRKGTADRQTDRQTGMEEV